MHPALATLETTARQLQLSGELERSEFDRVMQQLRMVADGLRTLERRTATQKAASVDMVELLRTALAPADADSGADDEAGLPLQEMTVEGPAHDLRDLFCSIIAYARAVGGDPLDLRAYIRHDAGIGREKGTMQLLVHAPDLPDFLRRKLWDAARVRGGEVSVSSEPKLCRIAFTLPLERRLAPAD